MAGDNEKSDSTTLSAEEAFARLGDETRLDILQTLGTADQPLSFSELRDRVGYETAGNFSYHLDQLTGHFIRKTEERYALRPTGRRVVEAVLSGAVTDVRTVTPTRIDRSCPYCRAPVEVSYQEERLAGYCTECGGVYGDRETHGTTNDGLLGYLPLPPAGIRNRTIEEAERAAWTWGVRDMLAISKGVCPKCSARLEQTETVCSEHDSTTGLCRACGNRHAVQLRSTCTNCIFDQEGAFVLKLMATPELLAFVTSNGFDPVLDHWEFGWQYDEEVVLMEPFEAQFTFTLGDESFTVTVDEELEVVDVERV